MDKDKLNKIMVVKIGGSTLGSHDTTFEDIVRIQREGRPLVIVHGGAKVVTEWLMRQGTSTRIVRGERVTDKPALEMAIAVLSGLVKKDLVANINTLGGRAVGISGADGALIQSRLRDDDMGYVGAVVKVDISLLEALLAAGFVPVVAPLGLYTFDRPADAPCLLNINGDTLAGEIAAAIGADELIFLTDVAGICNGEGKMLPKLTPQEAKEMVSSGEASGGMIPKIRSCLTALSQVRAARIIDGRQPHALLHEVEGRGEGTTIEAIK